MFTTKNVFTCGRMLHIGSMCVLTFLPYLNGDLGGLVKKKMLIIAIKKSYFDAIAFLQVYYYDVSFEQSKVCATST